MAQTQITPEVTDNETSLETFSSALREATQQLCRDGLTIRDVASLISLAQFIPGVFVAVYDRDGRYLWISESFTKLLGLASPPLIGRCIGELFDSDWCRERMDVIKSALAEGTPFTTVEIFRGRRLEAVLVPVNVGTPAAAVMYIGRFGLWLPAPGSVLQTSGPETQLLETADWGCLSVLTRRELEVLRLVAKGLSNDVIAGHIHRTKRAVEWHIQKLYEHLACTQRSDLIKYGLTAGLHEIDDVHWDLMMTRLP